MHEQIFSWHCFSSAFGNTVADLPQAKTSKGVKFNFQPLKEDHYGERWELVTNLMPRGHQGVGVFCRKSFTPLRSLISNWSLHQENAVSLFIDWINPFILFLFFKKCTVFQNSSIKFRQFIEQPYFISYVYLYHWIIIMFYILIVVYLSSIILEISSEVICFFPERQVPIF